MVFGYVKMALSSISKARWRSFLTMLGVMIGVTGVVTIVSLGEGVKQQLTRQVANAGQDQITIRPGQLVTRNEQGQVIDVNLLNLLGNGSLSEQDIKTVSKTPGVEMAVPFGLFNGQPEADGRKSSRIMLVGTNSQAPAALNQELLYGTFFGEAEVASDQIVIGQKVAETLFAEKVPIGRSMKLRGRQLIVSGVFDKFENNPLTPGIDYNTAVFMPYGVAKELAGGQLQIYQIIARPGKGHSVANTVDALNRSLTSAHGGQMDFTVLQSSDNLAIASSALSLLTSLVTAIAAISLIIGGISIMNVMLVAVSERTHEIGVRKSVGATNHQILGQFLTEAAVISMVGGLFGILMSLLANYFIRLFTTLQPAVNVPIMIWAVLVAIAIGTFFGMAPALKAAKKDPIHAMRGFH